MSAVPDPNNLLALFLATPVSDHFPRALTGDVASRKIGPVLVAHKDETLPRVFRKLCVEGFLSCPVVEGYSRYIGFIDLMMIVGKVRDLFWGDSEEAWINFWEKEDRFTKCTVEELMLEPDLFMRDPYPPLHEDCTSFFALEELVFRKAHRFAVVSPSKPYAPGMLPKGPQKRLTGILTQSMIVSWLRQNKHLLGSLRDMSVEDMVGWNVVCEHVLDSSPAINAFTKLKDLDLSGLAVVDAEGLLVDAISIHDIRAVGASGEHFHRLYRSVKEFKRLARKDYPMLGSSAHFDTAPVPRNGLFVTPDDTFEDVIDKMCDGNIHRLFVCKSESMCKPETVVSQWDVLRVLLDHIKQLAATARVGSLVSPASQGGFIKV